MVPAGCRSPGRCCGNHSHQPDGISVGEHEKDGSGSVLPGPARLRSNSGPVWYLRSKRVFLDGLAMRSRGETRWKCSLITVTVCLVITHNVTFNCPLRSRRKGYRQSRLKRPIRFSFSKLGLCAFTTSHCNPSVELFFFFSNVATLCSYGEIILCLFVTVSQRCFQSLLHESKRQRGFRSGTKACDCTTFSMTQLLWCQL